MYNKYVYMYSYIFTSLQMIGLTMVAVGIWLLASNQSFDFITDTIYASPAALLIIAGVITVGIALVGILGAAGMWCGVLIVVSGKV